MPSNLMMMMVMVMMSRFPLRLAKQGIIMEMGGCFELNGNMLNTVMTEIMFNILEQFFAFDDG